MRLLHASVWARMSFFSKNPTVRLPRRSSGLTSQIRRRRTVGSARRLQCMTTRSFVRTFSAKTLQFRMYQLFRFMSWDLRLCRSDSQFYHRAGCTLHRPCVFRRPSLFLSRWNRASFTCQEIFWQSAREKRERSYVRSLEYQTAPEPTHDSGVSLIFLV